MRCVCDECACTMIVRENGLDSHCVCPSCLRTCCACAGKEKGIDKPLSVEDIKARGREDGQP